MVLAVGMWRKSLWPTGWLVGWLAGWLAGLFSRGLEQTTTNATWLATQDTYIQTATTAATATNCLCFYGKNIFETTTQVDDIKTKTSLWFHRKNDAPPAVCRQSPRCCNICGLVHVHCCCHAFCLDLNANARQLEWATKWEMGSGNCAPLLCFFIVN